MDLFKKVLLTAMEIDGIRLHYGVRDRDDERNIKELDRTTQALAVQNNGSFWDADCSKTIGLVRMQLRKSEKLPGELDSLAGKVGGNTEETRQLRRHAQQLRQASNSMQNILRDLEKRPTATFNGRALRPENMIDPIVLKHPGGPVGEFHAPSATLTVTGLEGIHVSLDIEHLYFTAFGGHYHNVGRAAKFVGTFSTNQPKAQSRPGSSPALEFDLGRTGVPVQVAYQATDFCSRFKVTLVMQGFGTCIFPLEVKFDKELVNLTEKNHLYINTYTNDKTHPDSHWGRPELVEAITSLADAFGRELEAGRFGEVTDDQKKIWVNDLSLPWGGLFYCYAEPKGKFGHESHRWGLRVDISYNKMNANQRIWFESNANSFFTRFIKHGENKNVHYHCIKKVSN